MIQRWEERNGNTAVTKIYSALSQVQRENSSLNTRPQTWFDKPYVPLRLTGAHTCSSVYWRYVCTHLFANT